MNTQLRPEELLKIAENAIKAAFQQQLILQISKFCWIQNCIKINSLKPQYDLLMKKILNDYKRKTKTTSIVYEVKRKLAYLYGTGYN